MRMIIYSLSCSSHKWFEIVSEAVKYATLDFHMAVPIHMLNSESQVKEWQVWFEAPLFDNGSRKTFESWPKRCENTGIIWFWYPQI